MSLFPSTLSTFSRPTTTSKLNNPSHSALHNTVSSALGQVEAVIGLADSGSVLGTIIGDLRSPGSAGGGHVQTAVKGGTGQTTFTKGDILVAQSSSVLTKLAVGADGLALVANSSVAAGVNWASGTPANVQSFLSSGVWTRPATASVSGIVHIELWGGGGSGGMGSADNGGASGGGGGGYVSVWYPASVLSSSVLVGVGAGGNSVGVNASGIQGGITVFNTITSMVTAWGGGGGMMAAANAGGGGGAGAIKSGSTGVDPNPGGAGSILGGDGGATNAVGASAYIGGGGGGDQKAGGFGVLGGGGGGGVNRSSTMGAGGGSYQSGAGSAGSVISSGSVLAGTTPAGGGGGGYGLGSSGAGGSGKAIISTYL
jgi:hypothetical protein